MGARKTELEGIEIEHMRLDQLVQAAINHVSSYGHYITHDETLGAGKFTVTFEGAGDTSIMYQKLREIGFVEITELRDYDSSGETTTTTLAFEYNPEKAESGR